MNSYILFTHLKTHFLIKLLCGVINAMKLIRINKCYIINISHYIMPIILME